MFNKLRLWFHRTFGKCTKFGDKQPMFHFVPLEKAYYRNCTVCGARHNVMSITDSELQHYHKLHRDSIEQTLASKATNTVDKAVEAVANAAEKAGNAMKEVSFPNTPRKPNRKTRRALAQARRKNNPVSFADVDEFMDEVKDYCEADTDSTVDE